MWILTTTNSNSFLLHGKVPKIPQKSSNQIEQLQQLQQQGEKIQLLEQHLQQQQQQPVIHLSNKGTLINQALLSSMGCG